jgi:hypothetical protein
MTGLWEVKSILEHQQPIVTIHGVEQSSADGYKLALAVYRFNGILTEKPSGTGAKGSRAD